ncbi:MAG: DUF1059 domain-containing protein, partial [Actinomycetota bacterium]
DRQGFAKVGPAGSSYRRLRRLLVQKLIQCPCGVTLRAGNDDELISRAQTHAKETHDMDLSREQALSMAQPES